MTNTDTADIDETVEQIDHLNKAGSELVRITVNNDEAAKAVPYIKEKLINRGVTVPIIGDFHYNGQDRKSTRLNSSHVANSYAVFCLKKKKHIGSKIFEMHAYAAGTDI